MSPDQDSIQKSQRAVSFLRELRAAHSESGVALIEVVVAAALTLVIAVSSTHMFLTSTRIAASNRVLTAARAIAQRNLDNATALRWTSTVQPSVLAITAGAGVVFDDDGTTRDAAGNVLTNKVALVSDTKSDGTTYAVISGTLTRVVTAVANDPGADIRRITFRLTYTYQGRNQIVEMSALRTIDDL